MRLEKVHGQRLGLLTKCNYAMRGESRVVRLEKGFQQGLMEPQAPSPGMAQRAALSPLGAGEH